MKRIFSRLLPAIAGVLMVVTSCYKDLGNYEYTTEPNAIVISEEMRYNFEDRTSEPFVFKLGEKIVIPAKYEIKDKTLTEDQILIEWYMGEEVVSNEKVLELDSYPAGRYTGVLMLTDTRYDMKYLLEFNFQVNEAYSDGWAILSDDGTKSSLAYLKLDEKNQYVMEKDVYATANGGAALATGVTDMVAHMYDTYPQTFALGIAQPGKEGPIELDVHNMSVIGRIKEEFTQPVDGIDFTKVAYMGGGSNEDNSPFASIYALTDEGELYIRKDMSLENNVVPHSGLFPSSPAIIEGGLKIHHWINTSNISMMMSGVKTLIAFDESQSRLVRINETRVLPFSDNFYFNSPEPNRHGYGWDGKKQYSDITFPEPFELSDYEVLAMAGGGQDCATWDTPVLSVVMFLKNKENGKNYIYAFRYIDYYGIIDVDLDLFFPVPDDMEIDPENMIIKSHIGGPENIIYFTGKDNKSIWYLNGINGNYNKVYTSSSEITGFGEGEIQNLMAGWGFGEYTKYYEKMIVGTADGNINVLQMDAAARANGNPKVLHTENIGAGAVKFVCYLPNQSASY